MSPRKGQHIKPSSERKGESIMIRLTEAERSALRRIAKRHKLGVTYFVREGIQLVIAKHEGEKGTQ